MKFTLSISCNNSIELFSTYKETPSCGLEYIESIRKAENVNIPCEKFNNDRCLSKQKKIEIHLPEEIAIKSGRFSNTTYVEVRIPYDFMDGYVKQKYTVIRHPFLKHPLLYMKGRYLKEGSDIDEVRITLYIDYNAFVLDWLLLGAPDRINIEDIDKLEHIKSEISPTVEQLREQTSMLLQTIRKSCV